MALYFTNTQIVQVGSGFLPIPGSYVQIVEGTITANFGSTTTDTWISLGTASITPTSASNSIFIYFNTCFRKDQTQGSWSLGIQGLWHDNSATALTYGGWNGGWRHTIESFRKFYVHSPASTATQTYSIRHYIHNAGGAQSTYYANSATAHDGLSFIRLMEIAA